MCFSLKGIFTWKIELCNPTYGNCTNYIPSIQRVFDRYYPNDTFVTNDTLLRMLTLPPRVLEIGLYKINLTVTVPNPNNDTDTPQFYAASSTMYISLVSSPLLACVNDNAPSMASAWDPTVNKTLDATCSSDPDIWPDQHTNLTYEWFCYRSCENAPVFDDNQFVDWSSSNPYSTSCPEILMEMSNMTFSTTGCFLPFGIHKSGPIAAHNLTDWNMTNPDNWITGTPNSMAADNLAISFFAEARRFWVYFTAADFSTVTFSTYSMFFKEYHYFIMTVTDYATQVS
jgi:hypothetical protein